MKVKIIRIGTSKGVRIPKAILESTGIEEEVVMEATNDSIVLRPAKNVRQDWEESFKGISEKDADNLQYQDFANDWDDTEWQW